jgi:hypothetical protein
MLQAFVPAPELDVSGAEVVVVLPETGDLRRRRTHEDSSRPHARMIQVATFM